MLLMKKGLIVRTTGSWFTVEDENGELFDCKVKGNFRIKGIRSTNPVAVGDKVNFMVQNDTKISGKRKTGWIYSIKDRKNYIIRRSPNLSKQSHIIAANIDQAILLATIIEPVTTTLFIDRYLASAEAYNVPVLLVFNKTDLYGPEETTIMKNLILIYSKIGYRCLTTSAETGEFFQAEDGIRDKAT